MSQSMAAPLRCVIYLRVSTEEQAERDFTEEGLSLPAQREACLQACSRPGLHRGRRVPRSGLSLQAGRVSATPSSTPMLQRIIEQGDIDAVVVHKIDRFARDPAHHLAVRAMLRQKGVEKLVISKGGISRGVRPVACSTLLS